MAGTRPEPGNLHYAWMTGTAVLLRWAILISFCFLSSFNSIFLLQYHIFYGLLLFDCCLIVVYLLQNTASASYKLFLIFIRGVIYS